MPNQEILDQIAKEIQEFRSKQLDELPEGAMTIAGVASEMLCSENTAKNFLNKKVAEGLLIKMEGVRIKDKRGFINLYLPNPDYKKEEDENIDKNPKSDV